MIHSDVTNVCLLIGSYRLKKCLEGFFGENIISRAKLHEKFSGVCSEKLSHVIGLRESIENRHVSLFDTKSRTDRHDCLDFGELSREIESEDSTERIPIKGYFELFAFGKSFSSP